MDKLLQLKLEVAQLSILLIDLVTGFPAGRFEVEAPKSMLELRTSYLSKIERAMNAYETHGGQWYPYTLELPTERQLLSGEWKEAISWLEEELVALEARDSFKLVSLNRTLGLNSLFTDSTGIALVRDLVIREQKMFSSFKIHLIAKNIPVFREFDLAFFAYLSDNELQAKKSSMQAFLRQNIAR